MFVSVHVCACVVYMYLCVHVCRTSLSLFVCVRMPVKMFTYVCICVHAYTYVHHNTTATIQVYTDIEVWQVHI